MECGRKGEANTTANSSPIAHPDTGALLTDPTEVSKAWQTHYGRLAQDVTGHSRCEQRWVFWKQLPQRRELCRVNTQISRSEMRETINWMKRHKAPGGDGVPADFLKMICMEGKTRMGTALLRLIQFLWTKGMIPKEWGTSTVVSIPKKGDLSDMNNYRGISLISTALKVLISVIARRLDAEFESKKLYSRAQAGFRRGEGCTTQGVCLVEVFQRRKLKGKRTFAMFVDMRKAYDTVPHEALFAKLDFWGVRGRALDFIRALYDQSRIAVRSNGVVAGSEPLLRGVRQGCPISPMLFNVFVNDILDGLQAQGVTVPGGCKSTRIPGLLYADDLVLMAPTAEALTIMSRKLTEWLNENEMSVGIRKCGVMVIKTTGEGADETPGEWNINHEVVPRVTSYRYLGIDVRDDLSVDHIVEERVMKSKKLFGRMRPFLGNQRIPIPMRAMVLKAIMVPTMLFGAAFAPMKRRAGEPLQTELNRMLRVMLNVKEKDTNIPVAPLYREFNIPPLGVSMYCERTRIFRKCDRVNTWASLIMTKKTDVTGRTWGSSTRDWLRNRFHHTVNAARKNQAQPATTIGEWEELAPDALINQLRFALYGTRMIEDRKVKRAEITWQRASPAIMYARRGTWERSQRSEDYHLS